MTDADIDEKNTADDGGKIMGTAAESDVGSVMCDLITIMPGFINRDYSQIIQLFNDYASDAFYQLQMSVYPRKNLSQAPRS